MKKEFLELANKVNNAKNQDEMDLIVKKWEIKNEDVDSWIDELFDSINEIDFNKLPYMLHSLYKTEDKVKFMFFCIILENTFDELPFMTNLEREPIFKAKFEMFSHTLSKVASASYNGVADCMYMILLNSDPKGTLLKKEEKAEIIDGINRKLSELLSYFNESENIDESAYMALEILLDVSCYINDEETLNLIEKISRANINKDSTLFLIKSMVINEVNFDNKIIRSLAEDDNYSYRLLQILEGINKQNIFPKDILTQEKIAKSLMIDWLKYPTELDDEPKEITFIDTLEKENIIYYIYKFSAKEGALTERGDMIGISGGFDKSKISTQNTGNTFSKFETIAEDYKTQAEDIIKLISNHWKNRASEE